MPSSYTTSLRLVLPVTGELTGTWGDTVNDGLTDLVDASVAGTAAVTMSDANYTLTVANGASDESRQMFVTLTGTLGASRDVICPAASKLYFVTNSTTGGFSIVFKTSAGTGITVPNGARAVLYCDGTNVVGALNYLASLTLGAALPVASGGTGATTSTGTGAVVLQTSPSLTTPAIAGGTITGVTQLEVAGTSAAGASVRLFEDTDNGTNYVDVKAPDTLGSDVVSTLPATTTTLAGLAVAQAFTASQRGAVTTDNDGSFDMNAGNNFLCTPSAGFTLTFTNITTGQSGNIVLVNGSNYAVAAAAAVKVASTTLATISTTGTYWLSYYSPDGTNVYVAATGVLA